MTIAKEYDFWDLRDACWDCDDVFEAVSDNNKEDDLMYFLEFECFAYDDTPTLTQINDILRFDSEWVLETLGIDNSEEEEDDEGEDDDA